MHDLRQCHCPIITPTLLCLKWPRLAPLLWSHCQLECKTTAKNEIPHKVQLLACDLVWKICTPFLTPVNSRKKGEHPSYSRVKYVPAGCRIPTSPRKSIVFAGQARNKPLSNMAMEMVLRRMKIEAATVHGFRSSFRDWAGNVSSFPREITETALAHVIGDKAEQAYRRSDALEKRRKLMDTWAIYCAPQAAQNVVQIRRAFGLSHRPGEAAFGSYVES